MSIIDFHVHLGGLDEREDFLAYYNKYLPDILDYMVSSEIKKCVLLCNYYFAKGVYESLALRKICELYHPRFEWMCSINEKLSSEDMFARLSFFKGLGACGIGEIMVHDYFGSEFCECIFNCAESLSMPVIFHMSPCYGFGYGLIDNPGLPLLEQSLIDFKNLIFIGHSQPFWHEISGKTSVSPDERNSWGKGKVYPNGRLIYLLNHYDNLYCDLSANSGGCAIMRDEDFGVWFINNFQDRLLFGSDHIGDGYRYPLLNWLIQAKQDHKISNDVFEKICLLNATRILESN